MSAQQIIRIHKGAQRELEKTPGRIDADDLQRKVEKAMSADSLSRGGAAKMAQVTVDNVPLHRIQLGDFRAVLLKQRGAAAIVGISKRSQAYDRENRLQTLEDRAADFDLSEVSA